ncbi:MAG: hypothetical protein Solivirus4_12 [Solivirus sp.]|uniref:Uncharacterized protein n=1 Tax=Solivirus sp. TaxID=2487772 RepID=A0A3G5AIC1_9VIRU|nr:MAG: hypothetical protein Solivirus4_12 [Solivirus sp.]
MAKRLDDILEEETKLFGKRVSKFQETPSDTNQSEVEKIERLLNVKNPVGHFVSYRNDFYIISQLSGSNITLLSLTRSEILDLLVNETSELQFNFTLRPIDINTFPNFTLYENLSRCKLIYSAPIFPELTGIDLSSDRIVELCSFHFEMQFSCEHFDAQITKIEVVNKKIQLECALAGLENNDYKHHYLKLYCEYVKTRYSNIKQELEWFHRISQIPTLLLEFRDKFTINISEVYVLKFRLERITP